MEQPLISFQTWLPLSQDHDVEPSCVCMYFDHGASMSLGQVGTTEAGIQRPGYPGESFLSLLPFLPPSRRMEAVWAAPAAC